MPRANRFVRPPRAQARHSRVLCHGRAARRRRRADRSPHASQCSSADRHPGVDSPAGPAKRVVTTRPPAAERPPQRRSLAPPARRPSPPRHRWSCPRSPAVSATRAIDRARSDARSAMLPVTLLHLDVVDDGRPDNRHDDRHARQRQDDLRANAQASPVRCRCIKCAYCHCLASNRGSDPLDRTRAQHRRRGLLIWH